MVGAWLAPATALVLGASAWAGVPTPVTLITANDETGFEGVPAEHPPGQDVIFRNDDVQTHNLTADDDGPDGRPLFRSGNVEAGGQRGVAGVPFLEPGSYGFHCTIHPATMRDTLVVGGEGPGTVPRPTVQLRIKSRRVEEVLGSGKLKVKARSFGPTAALDISIRAKRRLTKSKRIDLDADTGRIVRLALTKRGERKLTGADEARLRVVADVKFGFPAKTVKTLD